LNCVFWLLTPIIFYYRWVLGWSMESFDTIFPNACFIKRRLIHFYADHRNHERGVLHLEGKPDVRDSYPRETDIDSWWIEKIWRSRWRDWDVAWWTNEGEDQTKSRAQQMGLHVCDSRFRKRRKMLGHFCISEFFFSVF